MEKLVKVVAKCDSFTTKASMTFAWKFLPTIALNNA
jgi:hypothetical protein